MLATIHTTSLDGITALPVRVEADVHRGLPAFTIVGLPDAAVRETRERVRAALVNSGLEFPLRRIVVNLAPASLRKATPGLDLPIAAALLCASGQLAPENFAGVALAGELALDGTTRPTIGALPMAEAAADAGCEAIVVPSGNAPEAALAGGIRVLPLDALATLPRLLVGEWPPSPRPLQLCPGSRPNAPNLADLRGLSPQLRLALEVAAAGGHPLLLVGPPGAGKSLAALRLPSIVPPPTQAEALEVARIASASGRIGPGSSLPERPFRAPHHTISTAGLLGGGLPARPGEATLAHRGVLYLDGLEEFRRDALEAMRSPLRDGVVSVARAGRRRSYPCRFILVASATPCPCGRGPGDPACACTPDEVRRYQRRLLLGPFADELDLVIHLRRPKAAAIAGPPGEDSAAVRDRTSAARARQERRLGPGRCNAELTADELAGCTISDRGASLLAAAGERLGRTARDRALRVAQTLCDLAGDKAIRGEQIETALTLTSRKGASPR